jgi:hypothetical protein
MQPNLAQHKFLEMNKWFNNTYINLVVTNEINKNLKIKQRNNIINRNST